jgi:hypothetical protein
MMHKTGKTQSYDATRHVMVMFDLRIPGATKRLHRERAVWQEFADIEAMDENHFILIIWPGAARRLLP